MKLAKRLRDWRPCPPCSHNKWTFIIPQLEKAYEPFYVIPIPIPTTSIELFG
jgi:hypothetical protein